MNCEFVFPHHIVVKDEGGEGSIGEDKVTPSGRFSAVRGLARWHVDFAAPKVGALADVYPAILEQSLDAREPGDRAVQVSHNERGEGWQVIKFVDRGLKQGVGFGSRCVAFVAVRPPVWVDGVIGAGAVVATQCDADAPGLGGGTIGVGTR